MGRGEGAIKGQTDGQQGQEASGWSGGGFGEMMNSPPRLSAVSYIQPFINKSHSNTPRTPSMWSTAPRNLFHEEETFFFPFCFQALTKHMLLHLFLQSAG